MWTGTLLMPDTIIRPFKSLISIICIAGALFIASAPTHAYSQTVKAPSTVDTAPLQNRINDVVRLLQGAQIEEEIFNQNFLNAVPAQQFRVLIGQIVQQHGQPVSVLSINVKDNNNATFRMEFEKSIGQFIISIEPNRPYHISGLRITSFESADNSINEVLEGINALPGRTGVSVAALSNGKMQAIAQKDNIGRYAIASTFKLYILAELDRQVQSGQRKWSDVYLLGPKSHPSGVSQDWPDNMPMTLQTLATLMISVSDNSATDTLIRILGQDALQSMVRTAGHSNADEFTPFLMTRQVTALKTPANAELLQAYLKRSKSRRTGYLRQIDRLLTLESIDFGLLTSQPILVDTIEWFASPDDIIRLLAYIDANSSQTVRDILAINSGIGKGAKDMWQYLGYKGGSDTGIMSLNFLLESKQGQKYAVSVHWNDKQNPVKESRLLSLTSRLLNLLADK